MALRIPENKANASDINFALHDAQLEVHDNPARHKVVVAGRRFGKSYLACIELLLEGLKEYNEDGRSLLDEDIYYIAPTFEQAKRIMWPLLKRIGRLRIEGGIIEKVAEKECYVILINGRKISIKGADDPDSLRGVGLSFAVMDEYAFMKPEVWEVIVEPAMTWARGRALFIGTPEGKNHFYDLWTKAKKDSTGEWAAFHYKTIDNPTLPVDEVLKAKRNKSSDVFRQEYEASFDAGGKGILKTEWWQFKDGCNEEGDYYIAVDLAGFTNDGTLKKKDLKVLDDHAIVICKVGTFGWYVEDIWYGKWDVRRTATYLLAAYRKYRPIKLGIEKGIAKNAVMTYLEDEMKRYNIFFPVYDLTHGGNKKEDRIRWALQGRLEKKRVFVSLTDDYTAENDQWQKKLVEQANDFPSSLTHDDLIDALAYIDQLADVVYYEGGNVDNWEPLDLVSGF